MPSKLAAVRSWLVACLLLFTTASFAQQKTVTGKVTGEKDKQPIVGATIAVKGGNVATQTGVDGSFTITVPSANSTLIITSVGFATLEVPLEGKETLAISLKEGGSTLNEVVITGYTAQRKKDIIGAVSVVNNKDLQTTPAANLGVQLQGRAAGVVVSSAGEPGAGAVVRIRGFASAGNNNPLYIIDGIQTSDPSKLNPNDIESMQILKDATSASIYGARASNGVVIITTKQGKIGRSSISYDMYVGAQRIPANSIPDLLNTTEYLDYLTKTNTNHVLFGNVGNFKIPDFIVVSPGYKGGAMAGDPRVNPDLYNIANGYQILKTSPGTNWFKEMSRPGFIQNHQITASGGTDKATFSSSFNYFDQKGTFMETYYKRYSARVNSSFKPKSFLRIGEALQVSYEDRQGGSNRGEGDAWASAYRMVPYIPVYDIKGGFGGNGVGESGNGSSPVANLVRASDNTNKWYRIFGNVFAEVNFTPWLTGKTVFGADMGTQFQKSITKKTYERSENVTTTQLDERSWYYFNWIWTNTLEFKKTFADDHDVKLLAGTEAVKEQSRGLNGFAQNFDFETPDFVSLNTGVANSLGDRGVGNFNLGASSLFSYFARLDYAFKGKYLLNATFRRDGSSRFGPNARYGNFPAVGAAWRVSDEAFLKNVSWLTDLKLRAGWGIMGSQSNVGASNQFSTYIFSPGRTNYDIGGTNTSSVQGYRPGQEGNLNTKWEETESVNVGVDATLFNGLFDVSVDYYTKNTSDLLVPQLRNGLEPLIGKPFVNFGTMQNRGIDVMITSHTNITRDLKLDATLTFSHYKNKILKVNQEGTPRIFGLERLSNAIRTQTDYPIGSFHGFVIDGFFDDAAELAAGPTMDGAVVGSWKFKDLNGDKKIDDNDRTFIGSPHPDFQMGLNLNLSYKAFDFSAFFFWNQGNDIYNYAKWYTHFRGFVGGVSKDVLYDSWTPTNKGASLPFLGPTGTTGFTSFTTSNSSSFFIEDGSYLRAKNLQLGYTLPRSLVNTLKIENVRFYIQAQNLFTITKYSGPDPDLMLLNRDGSDNTLGVDLGGFPNLKQFLFGLNVTF